MKRLYISLLLCMACSAFAQELEDFQPQRTPEEIARKQTTMLARELSLTDSSQLDTLYRMHLKFANLRVISCTRAENLDRLQKMTIELQGILTTEQFRQFMNRQVDHQPRHPHPSIHSIAPVTDE